MTRDADRHEDGRGRVPGDTLDPGLQATFDAAFVDDVPVDVGARHLWQLYRSARPRVVDGLAAAPRPGQLRRFALAAMLGFLALVGPGSLTAMSQGALPGDPLYGVKLAHEQAEVARAFTWEQRDAALFTQAELRLMEAEELARTHPMRAPRAIAAVDEVIGQLEQSPVASSRDRAEVVRGSVAERLTGLADHVDEGTREVLMAAIDAVSSPSPSTPGGPRSRMVAQASDGAGPGTSVGAPATGATATSSPRTTGPEPEPDGEATTTVPGPATVTAAGVATPAPSDADAAAGVSALAEPTTTPGQPTPAVSATGAPGGEATVGRVGCATAAPATATPAPVTATTPDATSSATAEDACTGDGAGPDADATAAPTDGGRTPGDSDGAAATTTAAPTATPEGPATARPSATASGATPAPASPDPADALTATTSSTPTGGASAGAGATSTPAGPTRSADAASVAAQPTGSAPGADGSAVSPVPSASGTAVDGGHVDESVGGADARGGTADEEGAEEDRTS